MAVNKRFILLGAGFLALFFLIYALFRVLNQPVKLPDDFSKAREEASRLSQEIVGLTAQTNALIKEVNISDLAGRPAEALNLIEEARKTNESAYSRAFELSEAAQKLVESASGIGSKEGQQLAYEAASLELALISNFINYTLDLNNFLKSLEAVLRINSFENQQAVTRTLGEVNQRIFTINSINKEFLVKMSQLDSL